MRRSVDLHDHDARVWAVGQRRLKILMALAAAGRTTREFDRRRGVGTRDRPGLLLSPAAALSRRPDGHWTPAAFARPRDRHEGA